MSIPILFLDFDGVLNNVPSLKALGPRALDVECVKHLNTIVERVPRLRIVVSSTWRLLHTLEGLRDILVRHGFEHPRSVIGKTPSMDYPHTRGCEITSYLYFHPPGPIAILDDENDMAPHLGALFQTDVEQGLTAEIAAQVVERLNQ